MPAKTNAPEELALTVDEAPRALVLGTLIDWNRRLSRAITLASVHEANAFAMYRKVGGLLMSRPDVSRVVDVGAGKSWHFPQHYKD